MNNCTFSNNTSKNYGAGVYCEIGGTVNNCALLANPAAEDGGGAYLFYGGTLNNCTISGNSAAARLRAAECIAIMAGR